MNKLSADEWRALAKLRYVNKVSPFKYPHGSSNMPYRSLVQMGYATMWDEHFSISYTGLEASLFYHTYFMSYREIEAMVKLEKQPFLYNPYENEIILTGYFQLGKRGYATRLFNTFYLTEEGKKVLTDIKNQLNQATWRRYD